MAWSDPSAHVWTTGEVVTAANMNTYIRLNLSHLSTARLATDHQTGSYYGAEGYPAGGTSGISADQLWGVPIFIPATKTYDRIGAFQVTAGSTTGIRLGIYNDNGGVPGSLVLDSGALTVSGAGDGAMAVQTISQSLSGPGKYWLAVLCNNTYTVYTLAGVTGGAFTSGNANQISGVYKTGVTYGALPDPFGAITSVQACALLGLRAG